MPPRPAAGVRPAGGGEPAPWGAPVDDTVHRARVEAQAAPEPVVQRPRRAKWPLLVAAGVLVLVVVGIFFLLPKKGVPGADPDVGTSQGDDAVDVPNDNLGDLVPPVASVETGYDESQGAAMFDVALPEDWRDGTDTLAIRRVDDPLVTNPYEETEFTRIFVGAPMTERVCLEIVVKRDGRMSEPTTSCVPE